MANNNEYYEVRIHYNDVGMAKLEKSRLVDIARGFSPISVPNGSTSDTMAFGFGNKRNRRDFYSQLLAYSRVKEDKDRLHFNSGEFVPSTF